MAVEQRRVAAETAVHARALADNLTRQGFVVESQHPEQWTLRKPRRRGDIVVLIAIAMPFGATQGGAPAWGPPSGPPAT